MKKNLLASHFIFEEKSVLSRFVTF